MSALDAKCPNSSTLTSDDPIWLQELIAWFHANLAEFKRFDRMQYIVNRAGDHVEIDYSVKSIKLR